MKQIFTLTAICLLSMIKSFGQTTLFENFESFNSAGWTLSGPTSVVAAGKISGKGLMYNVDNTSTAQGVIITPSIQLVDQFANFSFKYLAEKLTSALVTRTISYGYFDGVNWNTLGTITINNSSSSLVQISSSNVKVTPGANVSFRISINGVGDQSSDIYIDDISISASANSTLPIILNSFTGSVNNNRANLSWNVSENETGDRFEIEKSADGKNFSTEATVFTTEKVGTESYSYKSMQDLGNNTTYRLKIINKNNTISYSRIVYLKSGGLANGAFTVLQNPIRSSLAFTFEADETGVANVHVYNTAGVKVHAFKSNLQKGMNTVVEAINDQLKTGTYVLEVISGSQRKTTKIYKQ